MEWGICGITIYDMTSHYIFKVQWMLLCDHGGLIANQIRLKHVEKIRLCFYVKTYNFYNPLTSVKYRFKGKYVIKR